MFSQNICFRDELGRRFFSIFINSLPLLYKIRNQLLPMLPNCSGGWEMFLATILLLWKKAEMDLGQEAWSREQVV